MITKIELKCIGCGIEYTLCPSIGEGEKSVYTANETPSCPNCDETHIFSCYYETEATYLKHLEDIPF